MHVLNATIADCQSFGPVKVYGIQSTVTMFVGFIDIGNPLFTLAVYRPLSDNDWYTWYLLAEKGEYMRLDIQCKVGTVTIDDDMVCNFGDYIPQGEFNPHNVRPFIIGHAFGAVAIAFACCLSEALDIAADKGKLDCFKADASMNYCSEFYTDDGCDCLSAGNASECYDDSDMWTDELQNPVFSFVALVSANVK